MSRPSGKKQSDFIHHFEGKETLDSLLELADIPLETDAVLEFMQEAHSGGHSSSEVLPELLGEKPQFPSPETARRIFQNLLGLWDEVSSGEAVRLETGPRPPRAKRVKPAPPPPFAPGEPDEAFVEAAWRYLEDDEKARTRLLHVFDNRQDALLAALDEENLKDEGYAVARHLLFELHAMLELGWPAGLGSASLAARKQAADAPLVPAALAAYAAEALHEAEQDEESPLTGDELVRVRSLVERGLSALWSARKGV